MLWMRELVFHTRPLNNGIFQINGDFPQFFEYRISIQADKSVRHQLKGL